MGTTDGVRFIWNWWWNRNSIDLSYLVPAWGTFMHISINHVISVRWEIECTCTARSGSALCEVLTVLYLHCCRYNKRQCTTRWALLVRVVVGVDEDQVSRRGCGPWCHPGTELPWRHWGQLIPMKIAKSFTNQYYLVLIYPKKVGKVFKYHGFAIVPELLGNKWS
jgi:hypothetical protein